MTAKKTREKTRKVRSGVITCKPIKGGGGGGEKTLLFILVRVLKLLFVCQMDSIFAI